MKKVTTAITLVLLLGFSTNIFACGCGKPKGERFDEETRRLSGLDQIIRG